MRRSHPRSVALLFAGLSLAGSLAAEPVTRAEVESWLQEPAPAKLPALDSVIGAADVESVRSLLLPGFYDFVNYPEVELPIQAPGDYRPPEVYQAATAANLGKATLRPDGGMDGYVAGQPFDPERLDDVTPEEAGMMLAWNNVHRWQYYGYKVDALEMIYVQGTGTGTSAPGMEGGGHVERSLVQTYHRVYLNHLAMLPAQGYKVNASDSDKRFYKDYISFVAPFDVKGTTFVVERSLDPNEEDQVSSYLPKERRVRRLSAQERADKFMGSNYTLDDFEAFSGRVMDYVWIYRGQKQILHVIDSREPTLRFGGPQSNVPIDRWQVRSCFVVELKPRWEGHPMSSKFLLIDQQTYSGLAALVIDRKDQLWRLLMPIYQWPQPDSSTAERTLETSVLRWRGAIGVDFTDSTTTVTRAITETEFPTMADKQIERKFSISSLSDGR